MSSIISKKEKAGISLPSKTRADAHSHCTDGHAYHLQYTPAHAEAAERAIHQANAWVSAQHSEYTKPTQTTLAKDAKVQREFKDRWEAQRKRKHELWKKRRAQRQKEGVKRIGSVETKSNTTKSEPHDDTIKMSNPLNLILHDGAATPTRLDRLRSALSPRSAGKGAYSPLPTDTTQSLHSCVEAKSQTEFNRRFDDLKFEVEDRVGSAARTSSSCVICPRSVCVRFQFLCEDVGKEPTECLQNESLQAQAEMLAIGCDRLFSTIDESGDSALAIAELEVGLEDNHMLVSLNVLNYIFSRIDSDRSGIITKDEWRKFMIEIRPYTRRDKTRIIVLSLIRTASFWMLLAFIVGSFIGVGSLLIWATVEDDVKHGINIFNCYLQLLASLGFVFLSVKFNFLFIEELELGKIELINAVNLQFSNKCQAGGTELPADKLTRRKMAASHLFSSYDRDGDMDFGIDEWRDLLHSNNILISEGPLTHMFHEANLDGDHDVDTREFEMYIATLEVNALKDKLWCVLMRTLHDITFWYLIMFLIGAFLTLGNNAIWRSAMSESSKASVDMLTLYMNMVGSLGFVNMLWKSKDSMFENIERARVELHKLALNKYKDVHRNKTIVTNNKSEKSKMVAEGAWLLFMAMDGDDDTIDVEELREGLEQNDLLMSQSSLEYMFRQVDTGNDMRIERQEFENYIASIKPSTSSEKVAFIRKQVYTSISFWLLISYTLSCGILIGNGHLWGTRVSAATRQKLVYMANLGFLVASVGSIVLSYDSEMTFVESVESTLLKLKMAAIRNGRDSQTQAICQRSYHSVDSLEDEGLTNSDTSDEAAST